jgi:hypothetical protein
MLFGKIPFATLSQRHLVYAYCAVWLLQFGYATWLGFQWRKSTRAQRLTVALHKSTGPDCARGT